MGSVLSGGGPAFGAGYTALFGDTGRLEARAARSVRNYKGAEATLHLHKFAKNRVKVEMRANWLDVPSLAFYGVGNDSLKVDRGALFYKSTSVGVVTRLQAAKFFAVGVGLDAIQM